MQNIIIVSLSNKKNSMENAFLKFKAMQFYLYLLEAENFLRQTIEILEREKKKKSEEFQAVKNDYTNN